MNTTLTLAALIPFYLLGAFPTGYLIARTRGVTIWDHGSGNVGATNVARVIGASAGRWTLLGDVAKGLAAVLLGAFLTSRNVALLGPLSFPALCGVVVVLGHCVSLPTLFRGGKGVATTLGVTIALTPTVAAGSLVLFFFGFTLSRMVSVGSLVAVLAAPALAMMIGCSEGDTLALALIAAIVTWRHRGNIKRLVEGREREFRAESNESASSLHPPPDPNPHDLNPTADHKPPVHKPPVHKPYEY